MHIAPQEHIRQKILFAIWVYFWLILLEGALRKWFLPSLSTPLLIIRDPVVIYIYWIAWRSRLFPRGPWINVLWVLGFSSVVAGLLAPVLTVGNFDQISFVRTLIITIFGLRTNLLHLPLIFLMGRVLNPQDVIKFGRWMLIASLGIAILMLLQFSVSPNHFLNVGVGGEEAGQLSGALGKIRPPGPFSFVTGPALFFPLVAAYLGFGFLTPEIYSNRLLIASALALVTSVIVSISRGLLIAVALVIVSGIVMVFVFRPRFIPRLYRAIALVAIISIIIILVDAMQLLGPESFIDQGFLAFRTRFEAAAKIEGGAGGFVARALSGFNILQLLSDVPLFGYGLGLGTNVGAVIASGERTFIFGIEGEWGRIIAEQGPIIGLWFILYRAALTGRLGWLSFLQMRDGSTLAWLLFTAMAIPLIIGQFGPPTQLGFAVFGAGLCLASCNPNTFS